MKMIFLVLALLVSQVSFAAITPPTLTLSPAHSFLLPGQSSSCRDLKEAAEFATIPNTSIRDLRFSFNSLNFEIPESYDVQLVRIRVEAQNPNLVGGKFVHDIGGVELEALFETMDGLIPGPSLASTRNKQIGSCSFQVGSIALVAGASAFTADLNVEALGYAILPDGTYEQIRVSTKGLIEYIP